MAIATTGLLLCDLVWEDPQSHKHTLLGVFTGLTASRFPSPSRDFSLYALLRGRAGEFGELYLECLDDTTGAVVYASDTRRIQLGMGGKHHLHVRVGEFRFPASGVYRFRLQCNGMTIGEQWVSVRDESGR